MKILFLFSLFAWRLTADILALYLTWYGDPTTTMAIQWHSPLVEETDTIAYQSIAGEWKMLEGSHLELGGRLIHKIFLDDLIPDTEYSFRVGTDPAIYKFRTAPKTLDRPLRFCIGGDLYQSKELFRKMCRTISAKDPLFAVLGGDIAYAINKNPFRLRSTARNQWFSFLQEWKEEMISPEGQVIPFLVVPGNHDITPDDSELFFDLFSFPEQKLYRTMDFGNYLSLIILDTGSFDSIEDAQTIWLQNTLPKRKDLPFEFVVYHKAAYPSVYSYLGEIPEKIRKFWCPLFDQYNLPIVFEHHNHAFKRTFPIRGNKIDRAGVLYLGDGCWGATPRATRNEWYLAKKESKNHVYLLELNKQSAKIEAIGIQGEVIDRLEIPAK